MVQFTFTMLMEYCQQYLTSAFLVLKNEINMKRFVAIIVTTVLFLPYSSAQEMSTEDTKEAIISAIEFCNATSTHDENFSYNTVMIYKSFLKDKVVADSIIYEFNRNQSGIVFYNSTKAIKKKNKGIKGNWFIFYYGKIDTNRIEIVLSDCFYKGKKTLINPDGETIICRKSAITGKWHIVHQFFIYQMGHEFRSVGYPLITKQLYENLQHKQLETENDYMLLFNYLRKQDDSEYYVKIKELLCSIIEKNPEITERVDNYFFLFSKFRIIDDSTSVIEENYKKITEKTH